MEDAIKNLKDLDPKRVVPIAITLMLIIVVSLLIFNPLNPERNPQDRDEVNSSVDNNAEAQFESDRKQFDVISIKSVGDALAVRGELDGSEFIEFEDKRLSKGIKSDYAGVNGDLYYENSSGDKSYVYNLEGSVSEGYADVRNIKSLGGELAFEARDSISQYFVVYNSQVYGDEYYEASNPNLVDGELAYKAQEGISQFIVYGGEEKEAYSEVGRPVDINGELTYRVREDQNHYIVKGGEKMTDNYDTINKVINLRDELVFVANNGGEFSIYRGEQNLLESKEGKLQPKTVTRIGGNLAYVVRNDNEEKLFYKGRQIGGNYSISSSEGMITDLNGLIAFAAQKDNSWYIIREN